MPPTTNYSRGGSHAADGQAWEPDLLENLEVTPRVASFIPRAERDGADRPA
ncbi:MAG: hypothetical protein V3S81_00220 [Anaerolineales bacterium]